MVACARTRPGAKRAGPNAVQSRRTVRPRCSRRLRKTALLACEPIRPICSMHSLREQAPAQLGVIQLCYASEEISRVSISHTGPRIAPHGSFAVVHGDVIRYLPVEDRLAARSTQVPRRGSCPMMVHQRSEQHGPAGRTPPAGHHCHAVLSSSTLTAARRSTGPRLASQRENAPYAEYEARSQLLTGAGGSPRAYSRCPTTNGVVTCAHRGDHHLLEGLSGHEEASERREW